MWNVVIGMTRGDRQMSREKNGENHPDEDRRVWGNHATTKPRNDSF
jgi:hypothetical protein